MFVVLALLGTCDTCCRTQGESCSTAFHNQPGQCCGFHDNVGQCCPYGARCTRCPIADQYRCAWPGERIVCDDQTYEPRDILPIFLTGTLMSILLLSCCQKCCIQSRPVNVFEVDGIPISTPQVAVPVTNGTLVQGGAGPENTALAVGAGLLGGMVLSDVLEAGYDNCHNVEGECVDVGLPPDE